MNQATSSTPNLQLHHNFRYGLPPLVQADGEKRENERTKEGRVEVELSQCLACAGLPVGPFLLTLTTDIYLCVYNKEQRLKGPGDLGVIHQLEPKPEPGSL